MFRCPARTGTRYQTNFEIRDFLVLVAYTAHYRPCDYALYKSTIDTDIDIDKGVRISSPE